MSPGSHAAGDGSFGRSAGIQVGRAALLILVAIAVGLLLLRHTGGGGPVLVAGNPDTTTPVSPTSTSLAGGGSPTTASRTPTTPTTATGVRPPQNVRVLVANGTSTPGLAGKISNELHARGYVTLASVNATQRPTSTVVYFQPSYSGDAASLATKLSLGATAVQAMPSPPPVSNLSGAYILVVVGPDLASSTTVTT